MDSTYAKNILETFLSYPLYSVYPLLATFENLPRAIVHLDGDKKNFIYVPGERKDRVLLVAHADTVWDGSYVSHYYDQTVFERDGIYTGIESDCGIGADDRAGCAILWMLRNSGHSLLIIDGEEHGQIGSHHIKEHYPQIFDELNSHSYVIQFDRRGNHDYKVYHLPVTKDFTDFIEQHTGYEDAGIFSRTDIVVLCRDICGVNLSVGYYHEHTPSETLIFDEWFHTLTLAQQLLLPEQKRYLLDHIR